jgi:adenylate kinase
VPSDKRCSVLFLFDSLAAPFPGRLFYGLPTLGPKARDAYLCGSLRPAAVTIYMKILIVTGPPYSGKGTQCEILSKALHFDHISTGDRIRQEKANRTEIARIMSQYEEKGDLVPDSLVKALVSQILDENKGGDGIILDGYPRTQPQVDDLLELVKDKNLTISLVINIEVPKEELLKRALKRAADSTRQDDKDPETHLKRLRIFESVTLPAIAYMRTRLRVVDIDGMGSIDEISRRIMAKIAGGT